VKETGWNDGVAGPEQRGVLSVGRDVCYTTVSSTQLYRDGSDPVSRWETAIFEPLDMKHANSPELSGFNIE